MSGVVSFFRRILGLSRSSVLSSPSLNVYRNRSLFAEGDRVLVNGKLSIPLQKNSVLKAIAHNEIIGQPISTFFLRSKENVVQKVEYPSLEQYIALTPRVVTPIYGSYSAFIVSLLDLHVHTPPSGNESSIPSEAPLEILEAGTGHGSLTLHLARAIAAANPPPPSIDLPERRRLLPDTLNSTSPITEQTQLQQQWEQWRSSRNAIIHSIDVSAKHSIHAEKLIRGFRQALYWPHIDFAVGNVEDWVAEKVHARKSIRDSNDAGEDGAFLSHVILDMPGVHERIEHVCKAMRTDGKLMIFAPSITQITDCVRRIHEKSLPLTLSDTVELGEGISNGRKWDLRLVSLRQTDYSKESNKVDEIGIDSTAESDGVIEQPAEEAQDTETIEVASSAIDQEPVLVCRPRVGERIMGGGFVGIWTKNLAEPNELEQEWLKSRKRKKKSTRR